MTYNTAKEALDELKAHPERYQTLDSLRALAADTSIAATGQFTLLYGGPLALNLSATQYIQALVDSKADIRLINNTPRSAFIQSDAYIDAIIVAVKAETGVTFIPDEVLNNRKNPGNIFLYEPITGIWADQSREFAAATTGPTVSLTPFGDVTRTFTQVELLDVLHNPPNQGTPGINGYPIEFFQEIYARTAAQYGWEQGLLEANKAAAFTSLNWAKDATIGDVGGKLVVDTTVFSNVVPEFVGMSLPSNATNVTTIGSAYPSLLDNPNPEKVDLVKTALNGVVSENGK